jgi:hypothetical protein
MSLLRDDQDRGDNPVKTPKAPDPYATAAAQTKSNQDTAAYQQSMNMINQVTPYGNVTYDSNGTDPVTGAPRYTATTSLSPELQSVVDKSMANSGASADLEGKLLNSSTTTMATPLDLSYGANEARLNELGRNTLDPQFKTQQDQLTQQLYDRGVAPGSEAYEIAMRDFNNNRNSAYNNLYLQGHQTAVNDAVTARNSDLNALNALRSGSQVSQPGVGQTAATPQTSVAGTNLAGLVEQNYQSQLSQNNAMMGGLFGLGSAGIMAAGNMKFGTGQLPNISTSQMYTSPTMGLGIY